MLRNLNEKLGAKFPLITLGYSMERIDHLGYTLLATFDLKASPVEGQPLQQKDEKLQGMTKVLSDSPGLVE